MSPQTPQTFPESEGCASLLPGLALLRGDTGVVGEVRDVYSSMFRLFINDKNNKKGDSLHGNLDKRIHVISRTTDLKLYLFTFTKLLNVVHSKHLDVNKLYIYTIL